MFRRFRSLRSYPTKEIFRGGLRETIAFAQKCCPNAPARKIARSIHEAARDKARAIAKTEAYVVSCRERKKVGMLFTHLKRILRLDRLRQRGPNGAKDEFLLAATAQKSEETGEAHPAPGARIHHMRRRGFVTPASACWTLVGALAKGHEEDQLCGISVPA